MKNATDFATDLQLPSLPEVILRALEACHAGDSYRAISQIVATDTALITRLLALSNSALYRSSPPIRSVEQALLRLGTHRFQTLLLTSALRQLLFELGGDEWQQLRDFWRHSLTAALTAKALATLTRYPNPEEAFLLGMVHNIGELMAIKTTSPERKEQILNHQNEIAAELVTHWGLGAMAADAMRYQQAPPAQLRDASHLVKLISLATRLALSDLAGIAAAGTIFGLQEDLTREIANKINEEVDNMAAAFGIPLDILYGPETASRQLKDTVIHQVMTTTSLEFNTTESVKPEELIASTVDSLSLLTGLPTLCFAPDGDELALLSGTCSDRPDLRLAPKAGNSALSEAFNTLAPVRLGERLPSVLDKQLLTILRTPSFIAVPVVVHESTSALAVFVVGLNTDAAEGMITLAQLFTRQLTLLTADHRSDQAGVDTQIMTDRLRRQVHEISNPLTIVKQYIFQLRNRLEDIEIQGDLEIIQEELDRAGYLLLQISNSSGTKPDSNETDLNAELESLARILEDSLFSQPNRRLNVQLSTASTRVQGTVSGVRQVIINLIRNAAESFGHEPGNITLRTAAPIYQNQRSWVELQIADNGPGIPDTVRRHLFAPVASSKGQGHSGLGLSIVKQLIDDMEGIVACQTGQEGTTFRILFPAASTHENDID
ncbi:MAG: HDOD domain-containing protein [Marinobacter sp.]|nr:HDOD domain-containing protein [Marinobacter sp.]